MKLDAQLPFLETAWSRDLAAEFFNEHVLPRLYPGQRVSKVKPERVDYRPGERCMVLYSVKQDSPNGRTLPPFAIVSFDAAGEVKAQYAEHYGGPARAASEQAVFVDDVGVMVEFFPSDWKLEGLRSATDIARMTPLLDAAADALDAGKSDAFATAAGSQWRSRVLRYHPRVRCVFEYSRDASAGASTTTVIGKTFARAAKAERVWSVLKSVDELRPAAARWRTPRPLAYIGDANLMLMEFLPGSPITDVVCSEDARSERCVEVVRAAAAALAELHRLPVQGIPEKTLEDARPKIYWRASQIAAVQPDLAREVREILDGIDERAASLTGAPTSFIHGSPSPKQFLVDGDRLSLVDFDGARIGDPAADLGAFTATLAKYQLKAAKPEVLEGLEGHFFDEYLARSADADVVQRARLVQAQELTNYAARNFMRESYSYKKTRRAEKPLRLLQEARACLAGL